MTPEPLIQKLFAIERAIGVAAPGVLRAMVIDAQETALRMDLENLHEIDAIRRRLGADQPDGFSCVEIPDEESGFRAAHIGACEFLQVLYSGLSSSRFRSP